ncbi:hypothetical protein [Dyadobacter chenhuakuii]|uniref:DUF4625 domain-containing protein n=1 Tax=Dyadobacter chenhuakuii TaxID=2909339 RepID=A0ABY4XME8_9BACT|nr:hypothetical protein [Dyadobacter chenhuakuii]MCF2494297.1 hypothetical protein [Dyadobacter chenhuakuii]USJ31421.1 hypothetical protein NFI80_01505 [Dyadobacter chenhuakuii]
MKIATYLLAISPFVFTNCQEKINTTDVIKGFSVAPKESVLADGSTKLSISVLLDNSADLDKRNIVFTASNGDFINGKDHIIVKKAEFEAGQLVARTEYIVPNTDGKIVFTAKPEAQSQFKDFLVKDSITLLQSVPKSIKLTTSSFSVETGFGSDVLITGKLSNDNNSGVSKNYKVVFEDMLTDGSDISGRFRQQSLSVDSNSQVSTIYSPGYVAAGTEVKVICYLLDDQENKTQISDFVIINVISNE